MSLHVSIFSQASYNPWLQTHEPVEEIEGTGFDDDQLVAEETLTIELYQDNRFSSASPVFADFATPDEFAAGNRWLYANVPLQPVFGINDLPIQGLAQGFCESVSDAGNGFCHFTYEFFELVDGAIVVYASLTAEGTTQAQGPSTLNVLGGTGELSGAVGEITLNPVGIDESIVPARIFKNGSKFLGNMDGYEAAFEVSVRYMVFEPELVLETEAPVAAPVTPPVAPPVAPPIAALVTAGVEQVLCPGQIESEYCDCDLDCNSGGYRCDCEEGAACCAR